MAPAAISVSNYIRLVRGNPNFRRLWLAQIVSENGDWFYTLAIYSLLLELTGKASSVAMALARGRTDPGATCAFVGTPGALVPA